MGYLLLYLNYFIRQSTWYVGTDFTLNDWVGAPSVKWCIGPPLTLTGPAREMNGHKTSLKPYNLSGLILWRCGRSKIWGSFDRQEIFRDFARLLRICERRITRRRPCCKEQMEPSQVPITARGTVPRYAAHSVEYVYSIEK
jgi:hypothetical protein